MRRATFELQTLLQPLRQACSGGIIPVKLPGAKADPAGEGEDEAVDVSGGTVPMLSKLRVLVANLSGKPQTVTLRGLGATPETTVTLKPYGIERIDRVID